MYRTVEADIGNVFLNHISLFEFMNECHDAQIKSTLDACYSSITLPPSAFSLSREIHLLWRAKPRCAEEAVRAWEKDVPHH